LKVTVPVGAPPFVPPTVAKKSTVSPNSLEVVELDRLDVEFAGAA
jgi:hypothetical protein